MGLSLPSPKYLKTRVANSYFIYFADQGHLEELVGGLPSVVKRPSLKATSGQEYPLGHVFSLFATVYFVGGILF